MKTLAFIIILSTFGFAQMIVPQKTGQVEEYRYILSSEYGDELPIILNFLDKVLESERFVDKDLIIHILNDKKYHTGKNQKEILDNMIESYYKFNKNWYLLKANK